ncbi:hypothetical protein WJX79_003964 [Trebouxia sp. C0005]
MSNSRGEDAETNWKKVVPSSTHRTALRSMQVTMRFLLAALICSLVAAGSAVAAGTGDLENDLIHYRGDLTGTRKLLQMGGGPGDNSSKGAQGPMPSQMGGGHNDNSSMHAEGPMPPQQGALKGGPTGNRKLLQMGGGPGDNSSKGAQGPMPSQMATRARAQSIQMMLGPQWAAHTTAQMEAQMEAQMVAQMVAQMAAHMGVQMGVQMVAHMEALVEMEEMTACPWATRCRTFRHERKHFGCSILQSM